MRNNTRYMWVKYEDLGAHVEVSSREVLCYIPRGDNMGYQGRYPW